MSPDWRVVDFTPDRGVGRIRNVQTGQEVAFAIEAWVPCDPRTARRIQDSETRREELLPQPGEPVRVEWRRSRSGTEVPGKVARALPIDLPPELAFLDWLGRLGQYIPALRDWTDEDWTALFGRLDEDIEDAVRSRDVAGPEQHLALLDWLRQNAPKDVVDRRLAWLANAPGASVTLVEALTEEGYVFVMLPQATVDALAAARVLPVVRRVP